LIPNAGDALHDVASVAWASDPLPSCSKDQTPGVELAGRPFLTPRDRWLAARALSGEAGLEWTFPLFLLRAFALEAESGPDRMQGLDLYYEHLSSWPELMAVLDINQLLTNDGVSPDWGYQIIVGVEIFESGYRAPRGRLPLPNATSPYRGRHSVTVLDRTEDEELIFANSWGNDWGDNGYGYISRAYFEAHVDSILVSRPAWVGWSPKMDEALRHHRWTEGHAGIPSPRDVADTWFTPNRRASKSIPVHDAQHQANVRRTFSARVDMPPFEMVDLRDAEGQILGRTHISHQRTTDTSVIEELFVAPGFRRQGYGRALLDLAIERAAVFRKERIELVLHEADASPSGGHDRAIAFGSACGFTWERRSSRRPNIVDTAYRRL
jgi:GNAT superfamily N-acetyltransferase